MSTLETRIQILELKDKRRSLSACYSQLLRVGAYSHADKLFAEIWNIATKIDTMSTSLKEEVDD